MVAIRLVPVTPVGPPPKVSVIVTAYNHERYLAQALESVLAQKTTFPFEIVVGEDCSTDGTRELLRRYHDSYPDVIRMVLPDQNVGPNRMYVEVMRVARGEYFALLDGDDYWISTEKLERQARFLDVNEDHQVCFHDATVVQEDGGGPPRPGMPALERDTFELEDILMGNFIPTVSVMHRRVDPDDLPDGFLEFEWADWLMLVSCAQRGHLGYLPGLASVYRVHQTGLWSSRSRESQIDEEIRVYQHLGRVLPEGHRVALQSGIRRCRVQQAVERAGLRHDRPVGVLSDPSGLRRWYLNGRTVWPVLTGIEPAPASVLSELDRMRRICDHAPSTPHWPTETPMRSADGQSFYFVIETPREWFERLPGLRAYLDHFPQLLAGEACAIFELPTRVVAEREIVAIRLQEPLPRTLRGRHLDCPQPGTVTTGAMIELIGWALGEDEPAVSISVTHASEVLSTTSLGAPRPDLAAAFPDVPSASRAGFYALLDLADLPDEVELVVTVELAGGGRVVLGVIRASLATGVASASGSP